MSDARIWQIDAVRGLAVIGMIIYHLAFALYFFGGYPVAIFHWSWELFQTLVAGTFLTLVGVSLWLSWQRLQLKNLRATELLGHFAKRSLVIFACALLITLVTWILIPQFYVRFGVLHFIAVASLLALPFLRIPKVAAVVGLLVLLIPEILPLPMGNIFTLWIGFKPANFSSLDYFPMLPWFGLVLIGIWVGSILRLPEMPNRWPWLCHIGRKALLIYLLHQPVVIALVYLLKQLR